MSNAAKDIEDRYRHGDLDFETAVSEVTGTDIGRDYFVGIVHSLRELNLSLSTAPVLSEHDAKLLDEAGFVTDPAAATAAHVDRDIRMQNLLRSCLTVAEAAQRVGVSDARIRQRLTDGTLWAFGSGRGRLLPPGQFTADGVVPHLEKVLPQLDKDLHPLTVQSLLTQPQPSLTVEGRPVSIAAWLTGCAGTAAEIEKVTDVIAAADWEGA